MKTTLRKTYKTKGEFLRYDEIYNIAGRLGFKSPEKCWQANPKYIVTTNPAELKRIK